MNKSDNNAGVMYRNILISILVLSLIPLLILHYFNQPTPEDFYYSGEAGKLGLWDSMRVLYKFYGGRYFTYLLISLNPLYFGSIPGYKLCTLLLMLLFYFILFRFISEFTKKSLNAGERILFSLSVFFLYLFSMSSLSQGYYWLVSSVHYQVALILFMLFIIYYSRIDKSKEPAGRNISTAIACLLTVAVTGTVELSAATMTILVSVLITGSLVKYRKISWWLILITILTIVSVYFVLKSPGNDQRSVKYEGNHNLLLSLKSSFTFLIVKAAGWKFNSPLIPLTVLFIPYYFKIVKGYENEFNPGYVKLFILILILLVTLYVNIFVTYWSLGIPPYDRILDFIYFIFLAGWFTIIIYITSIAYEKYKLNIERLPGIIYAAAVIFLAFFIVRENNIATAYSDLFSGKASEFNNEVNERYDLISKSSSDSLRIDTIRTVPETFFFKDITPDPKRPFNIGYQTYFNKKYIVRKTDKDK